MIITTDDFKGEAGIPGMIPALGTVGPANEVMRSRVQAFIDRYEPKFLLMFYGGDAEAADALLEYAAKPESARTSRSRNALLEALKEPLARYVAFHFLRHCTVANTTIGGVAQQGENGRRDNTSELTLRLWNGMADDCRDIYSSLIGGSCPQTEIFEHVNALNL